MKQFILLFVLVVTNLADEFLPDGCREGWTPSTYENGRLLCVKVGNFAALIMNYIYEQAFFKSYSLSFNNAAKICFDEGAFMAPMVNEKQEKAIREAASAEVPDYSWYKEPVNFYLGATTNENNLTFSWLYDEAVVSSNGTIFTRKSESDRKIENCLKFKWNNKEQSSPIVLEQTACHCVLPGYCIGKNRGVICARFESRPGRWTFNPDPENVKPINNLETVRSLAPKVSWNNALEDCRKIPGGNLATVPNKEISDFLQFQPSGHEFVAFGLRCTNVTYRGDRSNCIWNDGTYYKYQEFVSDIVPNAITGYGCCDHNGGSWGNCHSCDNWKFDSYICQAPLKPM